MIRNLLASLVAFGMIFGTVGCEAPKKASPADGPVAPADEKKDDAAPAADGSVAPAEGEEKKAE